MIDKLRKLCTNILVEKKKKTREYCSYELSMYNHWFFFSLTSSLKRMYEYYIYFQSSEIKGAKYNAPYKALAMTG